MSIVKEKDGSFNLVCDCCGTSINAASWDEAKASKSLYGWKSRKVNGEWQDVCDDCLALEDGKK